MRHFITLILLFCVYTSYTQNNLSSEKISVKILPSSEVKAGNPITLDINCSGAEDVEIAIFQNNFLGYQSNASLMAGEVKYEIPTSGWPSGKYYLLIKNKDIHIQEEIILTD